LTRVHPETVFRAEIGKSARITKKISKIPNQKIPDKGWVDVHPHKITTVPTKKPLDIAPEIWYNRDMLKGTSILCQRTPMLVIPPAGWVNVHPPPKQVA
jgi:hypothetical protein